MILQTNRTVKANFLLMKEFFRLNIKHLTKQKNITQKEFSEAIGVKPEIVSSWVGRGSLPKSVNIYIKVADFFGITVDDLFRVNMEEEGTSEKGSYTKKLEIAQKQCAEYKTLIKELKKDKEILQKAIKALTD